MVSSGKWHSKIHRFAKGKTETAEGTTTTPTKLESSSSSETVSMHVWQKKDVDVLAKIHLGVSDLIFQES